MDNFIFSINATIPIFLVILLGWFLMKIHIITEEFANVANKYVFKVALPVLLFRDIATTSHIGRPQCKVCSVLLLWNDHNVWAGMGVCTDIL